MRGKNHFPRLLAAILLTASLLILKANSATVGDLAAIRQHGTLTVGVKIDYPPFGFRSPSGEIEGLEPALAADVAASLGVRLELVPVTASNRIELLQQGKIDLIIATMNITRLRGSQVEIVRPSYYAAGYNVMVPKSMTLKSWTQMKGKQVCGVQDAYYNDVAELNLELQVRVFADTTEALIALKQGRCVGFLYDDTSIEGHLLDPAWGNYDMPLDSQEVQPWVLAVRKGEPEWSAYLSAMVGKWMKDGTILDLETRYHIKHSKFVEDAHQEALTSSREGR
jgi:polar amino acid transport system substrate-binding protein